MRVNSVEKARRSPGECGRCGRTITVGMPYRWAKGRYGPKMIRCEGAQCRFKPSDLTTSDKLSRLYAAREGVEEFLQTDFESADEVIDALIDAANEVREVADEYSDSANALDGKLNWEELEEKSQQCHAWADELESMSIDDFYLEEAKKGDTQGDETDEERKDRLLEEWREEVRSSVQDSLDSLEL
jgi:hypothetical protein